MQHTRRNVLAGIGVTLAVGTGTTQVFGQESESPLFEVKSVDVENEYVVFQNVSGETIDVSGWTVAFEYGNEDTNQRRDLPDGTVVKADQTLKVAAGSKDVSNAVVVEDAYKGEVIRNDGSDVIALLDSDGNEVCNSEDDWYSGDTTEETSTITEEETTEEETTTSDESDETTEDSSGDDSDSNESEDTTEDDSSDESEESDGSESSDDSESDSGTDDSSDEDDC